MNRIVYLDSAATMPLCPAARQVILDNLDEYYNVNSSYEPAHKLKVKVEAAREHIAELIGARSSDEIYFTSGGSEANSFVTNVKRTENNRIITNYLTSEFEHHSILNNPKFSDTKIFVDNNGIVNADLVEAMLCDSYAYNLVSVMGVNNELGTIQPIKDISNIVHKYGGVFHSDMVQMIPHVRVNVQDLCVDMISASGHKFGAMKSCGFVYIKNGIEMEPLIYGGSQERGIRGSTTNAIGILSMAAALQDTVENLSETNGRIAYLSAILEERLLNVSGVHNNVLAPKECRIPGVLNLRVDGCRGADIVAMASEYGVCISAGSACSEGTAIPSHVLKALSLSDEEALSSVRISIGRYNTQHDIDYASDILSKIIVRARKFR